MNNKNIGDEGEKLVLDYLKSNNYKVIFHNYRNQIGEIDIIAMDKDILAFIEVKTRNSNIYGRPSEAVDKRKQFKIIKTSLLYIQINKLNNVQIRYDVAEVYPSDNNKIIYIKNAFSAW
ncbi:MAG TPA: YraN family protein [Soehngenia sp.]|nr:YraN family protein [Soehngenia sp.]HPP30842.1 YraN family protein [Soehngenia sp.]